MKSKIARALQELNTVVLDKSHEVKLAMTCLLAEGHLLIEDVPGVGKTTMVRALGSICGLQTSRIQFTVDLLPSDLLGGSIYNQKSQEFEFRRGPIFSQMILADELNRASPRTQSALLQAMEEQLVSLDSKTYSLPRPFFVVATQNPHLQIGTFPLPESQLDRFMMSIELNYPDSKTEISMLIDGDPKSRLADLKAILSAEEFIQIFSEVNALHVSAPVAQYVSNLLTVSRTTLSSIKTGSLPLSTRAGLLLVKAAKAWAYIDGRSFISPEDIQTVMSSVLGHRLGGTHGVRRGREWALQLRKETEVPV